MPTGAANCGARHWQKAHGLWKARLPVPVCTTRMAGPAGPAGPAGLRLDSHHDAHDHRGKVTESRILYIDCRIHVASLYLILES